MPRLAITHLVLPRIGLDTDVVPAPFVEQGGLGNWVVPAFYAGHAESTAGAGQAGTAVLFGHITTLRAGNVFERLDRARVGDDVVISSEEREFLYRVDDVRAVARDDVSVLAPTSSPTLELITCTGAWDPSIWDYTERLVVHAALVPPEVDGEVPSPSESGSYTAPDASQSVGSGGRAATR